MSDSKALIRQWRLLRFLADARNGYTVRELKAEMNVSLETIRRDLKDLAGTPFWDGQQKVFNKIRGALGESALKYMQKLARSLHATCIGASDYATGNLEKNEIGPPALDRMPVISP